MRSGAVVGTRAGEARDEGITLVELLVGVFITSVVLAIVGGIFVSVTNTERRVSAITQGATAAQLVATSITERMRNGTDDFEVTTIGADQMLVTASAEGAQTLEWSCVAWYYSAASGGSIRLLETPSDETITPPTAEELGVWTLLIQGVSPGSGGSVFARDADGALDVTFNADAGDNPPVSIDFTIAPLAVAVEGEYSCF